jgi:hypothetical protein
MRRFPLCTILIGAGLMISGPVVAQNTNKGADSNATTGLSSAAKQRGEMGASSAGSTMKSTPTMHDDGSTGLSSAKKQREEANTQNR